MTLVAFQQMTERRCCPMGTTVLYRQCGGGHLVERCNLAVRLNAKVAWHREFPNHLILTGYHEEKKIADIIGGVDCEVTLATTDQELPFVPKF